MFSSSTSSSADTLAHVGLLKRFSLSLIYLLSTIVAMKVVSANRNYRWGYWKLERGNWVFEDWIEYHTLALLVVGCVGVIVIGMAFVNHATGFASEFAEFVGPLFRGTTSLNLAEHKVKFGSEISSQAPTTSTWITAIGLGIATISIIEDVPALMVVGIAMIVFGMSLRSQIEKILSSPNIHSDASIELSDNVHVGIIESEERPALGEVKNIRPSETGFISTMPDSDEGHSGHLWNGAFPESSYSHAVDRARLELSSPAAHADISRRLGIMVDEIPVVVGILSRDLLAGETIPVLLVDQSVSGYLGIDPELEGMDIGCTLGVFADLVIGPIPVYFIATRLNNVVRLVAVLLPLTKLNSAQWSNQREIFFEMKIHDWFDGGVELSRLGLSVNRRHGGLDLLIDPQTVHEKIWTVLWMSLSANAVSKSFSRSAPSWPYSVDLSGDSDSIFTSMFTGGFNNWY